MSQKTKVESPQEHFVLGDAVEASDTGTGILGVLDFTDIETSALVNFGNREAVLTTIKKYIDTNNGLNSINVGLSFEGVQYRLNGEKLFEAVKLEAGDIKAKAGDITSKAEMYTTMEVGDTSQEIEISIATIDDTGTYKSRGPKETALLRGTFAAAKGMLTKKEIISIIEGTMLLGNMGAWITGATPSTLKNISFTSVADDVMMQGIMTWNDKTSKLDGDVVAFQKSGAGEWVKFDEAKFDSTNTTNPIIETDSKVAKVIQGHIKETTHSLNSRSGKQSYLNQLTTKLNTLASKTSTGGTYNLSLGDDNGRTWVLSVSYSGAGSTNSILLDIGDGNFIQTHSTRADGTALTVSDKSLARIENLIKGKDLSSATILETVLGQVGAILIADKVSSLLIFGEQTYTFDYSDTTDIKGAVAKMTVGGLDVLKNAAGQSLQDTFYEKVITVDGAGNVTDQGASFDARGETWDTYTADVAQIANFDTDANMAKLHEVRLGLLSKVNTTLGGSLERSLVSSVETKSGKIRLSTTLIPGIAGTKDEAVTSVIEIGSDNKPKVTHVIADFGEGTEYLSITALKLKTLDAASGKVFEGLRNSLISDCEKQIAAYESQMPSDSDCSGIFTSIGNVWSGNKDKAIAKRARLKSDIANLRAKITSVKSAKVLTLGDGSKVYAKSNLGQGKISISALQEAALFDGALAAGVDLNAQATSFFMEKGGSTITLKVSSSGILHTISEDGLSGLIIASVGTELVAADWNLGAGQEVHLNGSDALSQAVMNKTGKLAFVMESEIVLDSKFSGSATAKLRGSIKSLRAENFLSTTYLVIKDNKNDSNPKVFAIVQDQNKRMIGFIDKSSKKLSIMHSDTDALVSMNAEGLTIDAFESLTGRSMFSDALKAHGLTGLGAANIKFSPAGGLKVDVSIPATLMKDKSIQYRHKTEKGDVEVTSARLSTIIDDLGGKLDDKSSISFSLSSTGSNMQINFTKGDNIDGTLILSSTKSVYVDSIDPSASNYNYDFDTNNSHWNASVRFIVRESGTAGAKACIKLGDELGVKLTNDNISDMEDHVNNLAGVTQFVVSFNLYGALGPVDSAKKDALAKSFTVKGITSFGNLTSDVQEGAQKQYSKNGTIDSNTMASVSLYSTSGSAGGVKMTLYGMDFGPTESTNGLKSIDKIVFEMKSNGSMINEMKFDSNDNLLEMARFSDPSLINGAIDFIKGSWSSGIMGKIMSVVVSAVALVMWPVTLGVYLTEEFGGGAKSQLDFRGIINVENGSYSVDVVDSEGNLVDGAGAYYDGEIMRGHYASLRLWL